MEIAMTTPSVAEGLFVIVLLFAALSDPCLLLIERLPTWNNFFASFCTTRYLPLLENKI